MNTVFFEACTREVFEVTTAQQVKHQVYARQALRARRAGPLHLLTDSRNFPAHLTGLLDAVFPKADHSSKQLVGWLRSPSRFVAKFGPRLVRERGSGNPMRLRPCSCRSIWIRAALHVIDSAADSCATRNRSCIASCEPRSRRAISLARLDPLQ